jgi:molybdopterin converting factor small subunit
MRIKVFATLKDYYAPEFELETVAHNTEELTHLLLDINGRAAQLLNSCKFAVGDTFIDKDHKLNDNDTVIIIPPSSGG